MNTPCYRFFADALLVVHVLFATGVVLGLPAIFAGHALGWHWTKNFWFRLLHLMAIAVVAGQAWAGRICPLTRWEQGLRQISDGSFYSEPFIRHWLQRLIYYDFPPLGIFICLLAVCPYGIGVVVFTTACATGIEAAH